MAPPVAPPAPGCAGTWACWTPALFADLPGWKADDLRDVRIAFSENCKGLRKPRGSAPAPAFRSTERLRSSANSSSEFVPYQLTRADAEDRGSITGYYEPLLKGSRTRLRALACRCICARRRLVVELGDLYPELRASGCVVV